LIGEITALLLSMPTNIHSVARVTMRCQFII